MYAIKSARYNASMAFREEIIKASMDRERKPPALDQTVQVLDL